MDRRVSACLLALFAALASPATADCRLCPTTAAAVRDAAPTRPLTIEVETMLDFSRVAQVGGGGSIAVDERSGARRLAGGLVDLGGMTLKGIVRVTGEPGRRVRISLPAAVRLTAPGGGSADVVDLRTDLPADPVLDGNGQLGFAFGGRLIVAEGTAGDLRGRIAITADYQ